MGGWCFFGFFFPLVNTYTFLFPFFLLFNKVPSSYTTDRSQSKVNRRNHSARTQMVLFYPHKFSSVPLVGCFWLMVGFGGFFFLFSPQAVREGGDLAPRSIPMPLPALPCPRRLLLLLPRTARAGEEPAGRLGRGLVVRVWPRDCFFIWHKSPSRARRKRSF